MSWCEACVFAGHLHQRGRSHASLTEKLKVHFHTAEGPKSGSQRASAATAVFPSTVETEKQIGSAQASQRRTAPQASRQTDKRTDKTDGRRKGKAPPSRAER